MMSSHLIIIMVRSVPLAPTKSPPMVCSRQRHTTDYNMLALLSALNSIAPTLFTDSIPDLEVNRLQRILSSMARVHLQL